MVAQAKTRTSTPPPRAKTVGGKDSGNKAPASKIQKENQPTQGGKVPEVKTRSRLITFKERLPSWCSRLVASAVVVGFFAFIAILIHTNATSITDWFRSSWCKQAFERIAERLPTLVTSDFFDRAAEALAPLSVHVGTVRTLLQRAIQTAAKLPLKDLFDNAVQFLWTNKTTVVATSAVSMFGVIAGFGLCKIIAKRRAKTA